MNAKQILSALFLTALLAVPLVPAQSPLHAVRCTDNVVITLIQRDSAVDPVPCIQQAVCPTPTTTPATTACGMPVCGVTGKDAEGTLRACGERTDSFGVPAPPALMVPPGDSKGYIVIPWGQAPMVRGVPAPESDGSIALLFFLTNIPAGSQGSARLQALGPLGNLLFDETKEVYFEDNDTSAGLVYFEAIPSEGAAKLQFSYGAVEENVSLDTDDVEAANPCPDAEACLNPCYWGPCDPCQQPVVRFVPPCEEWVPTDPCAYADAPVLCGPVEECAWPLSQVPPCQPVLDDCEDGQCVPPCLGLDICDIQPPCQDPEQDCTDPCTLLPALCDDKPCGSSVQDCVAMLCQQNPWLCNTEMCQDPEQDCTDPCTWAPALCDDKPCGSDPSDCVPSCEDNPQLCNIELCQEKDLVDCVSPCDDDPQLCDITLPCQGGDIESCLCQRSSFVCLLIGQECEGGIADCLPNPCATVGPLCDIGIPCADGGCLSNANGGACMQPECYEIPLPLMMSASAQDESGCQVALGVDGHAWLPAEFETKTHDGEGRPLAVIDYAMIGWAKQVGYRNTCNPVNKGSGMYAFAVQWAGPQDLRPEMQDNVYSWFFYHGSKIACSGAAESTEFAQCEPYSNHELWVRPDTRAIVMPNEAHFQFTDKPKVYLNGKEKGATECSTFVQVGAFVNDALNIALTYFSKGGWIAVGGAGAQWYLSSWLEKEACKFERWNEMRVEVNGETIGNGVAIAERSYDRAISMQRQREALAVLPIYIGGCAPDGIEFETMSRAEWSASATAGNAHNSMGIQWDGDSTEQLRPMQCDD